MLDLLRRVARPHDAIEGYVPGLAGMHDVDDYPSAEPVAGLLVYRYDSPLFFANAEDFHNRALAAVERTSGQVQWFVLNTEAIVEIDITAMDVLETPAPGARRTAAVVVALARVKQDLRNELAPTGFLERIGEDHIFPTLPTAVEAFREWRATHEDPSGDQSSSVTGPTPGVPTPLPVRSEGHVAAEPHRDRQPELQQSPGQRSQHRGRARDPEGNQERDERSLDEAEPSGRQRQQRQQIGEPVGGQQERQ